MKKLFIASILNKHGHGKLYFGVKDNGDVIGQEMGKDTERKLSRDISDNVRPAIWYEVKTNHSDDGKAFMEVSFNGSNLPYSAYGRYYIKNQYFKIQLIKLIRDIQREKDYEEIIFAMLMATALIFTLVKCGSADGIIENVTEEESEKEERG